MNDNFILQNTIDDLTICNKLIEYHKNSKEKFEGRSGGRNGEYFIDKSTKDSIDVFLDKSEELILYIEQLKNVVNQYIEKYPMCNNYAPWSVIESIQIQHYVPSGGYHAWHTERTSNLGMQSGRHLAFMTYLNDVTDNGETEFYHQQIKIQPKKGLTVIWPADWTHTHRGIPSPTQEKYIITGWFNFTEGTLDD
jgi:hypothetical protein